MSQQFPKAKTNICIDSVCIPFAITPLLDSLESTPFRGEIKELEWRIDNNEWKDVNGSSLSWKKLANKIRGLFCDFTVLKGKLEKQNEMSRARMVTNESQGKDTSQASKLNTPQQSGGSRHPRNSKKSTEKATEPKKNMQSKAQPKKIPVVKTSEVSEVAESSYADEMASIPHSGATDERPDYEEVSRVYNLFRQPARMRTFSSWMTRRRLTSHNLSSHQPLSTFDQRRIESSRSS